MIGAQDTDPTGRQAVNAIFNSGIPTFLQFPSSALHLLFGDA